MGYSMGYRDYYQILGISPRATTEEIKKAYRQLARQYHPDLNPGNESAEQKFKEINEANEILSSEDKRTRFDHLHKYWQKHKTFGSSTIDLKKVTENLPSSIALMGLVRVQISHFFNTGVLMFQSEPLTNMSLEQISDIIKCDNYTRVTNTLNQFIERGLEQLQRLESRVEQAESEYNSAVHKANRNRPGGKPSKLFIDFSDPAEVNSYNRKVTKYNNKVHEHSRLINYAERCEYRYNDLVSDYNAQANEFKREVEFRKKDIAPAMDTDIIELLNHFRQEITKQITNNESAFTIFIMVYLWKRAHFLLNDVVGNPSYQRSISDLSNNVKSELDRLLNYQSEVIKQHLFDALTYVYACALNNQNILYSVQRQLDTLPADRCKNYVQIFNRIINNPINTDFQYKDIIEPEKLLHIMHSIRKRGKEFQNSIKTIDVIVDETSGLHGQIYQANQGIHSKNLW